MLFIFTLLFIVICRVLKKTMNRQFVKTNKILVEGIPSNVTSDKLIIYFQKKKNVGGGDVDSVTYPLSDFESDKAVVKFEETDTKDSVLRYQHKIGGKSVSVRPFYSEVIENVTANISDKVVAQLEKTFDLDQEIDNLEGCTGAVFTRQNNGFEIRGEWYQMKAALEHMERMWDKTNECTDMRPEIGEYMSHKSSSQQASYRQSSKTSMETSSKQTRKQSNSQKMQSSETETLVLDKDMFAFIEKAHPDKVESILTECNVGLTKNEVGDAVHVVICEKTPGASHITKASKALSDMYTKIRKGVKEETLDVQKEFSLLTSSDIENLINDTIQPEFPAMFITRMTDSASVILFLAEASGHCKSAINQFRYFADRLQKEREAHRVYKTETDKDLFNYAELVHAEDMHEIWERHGVQISTKIEGDCARIDIVHSGKGEFQPDAAITDFQKIMKELSSTIAQGTEKIENDVPKHKVDEAMKKVKDLIPDVLIAAMHDQPNEFIFLAKDKNTCDFAQKLFLQVLSK